MKLLFRSIAGSHLYGLNHAGSDQDFFEVWDKLDGNRKSHTRQTIKDGIDTIQTDMSSWLNACWSGSHQHLDAMFTDSVLCEVDHITEFRMSYRPHIPNTVNAFRRVIRSFEGGNLKQRRHSVRIRLHVEDLLTYGFYNPTLSPQRQQIIRSVQ